MSRTETPSEETVPSPDEFFDLTTSGTARDLFAGHRVVWGPLSDLDRTVEVLTHGARTVLGDVHPQAVLGDGSLFVGEGARIEPGAYVQGPAFVGPRVVVRHGAYVRSGSVLLDGAVLGHASEIKHSILLPGAKAPHFAYVGDSILGNDVNLGAGTRLSNLPITLGGTRRPVRIVVGGAVHDTGLTKLGAVLGDGVQTGCNVVTNPGAIVGPRTVVYPGAIVAAGVHPPDSVIKLRQRIEVEPFRAP